MKNILIISFSNISKDPRVLRQIEYFSEKYTTTVIGFSNPKLKNITFVEINQEKKNFYWFLKLILLLFGFYELYYLLKKEVIQIKKKQYLINKPDVIIANDYDTLKIALTFKNSDNILVFDSHEYSPEENTDSLKWKLLMKNYIDSNIKKYAKQAEIMVTVSYRIIEKYKSAYNLNPILLTNAPFYFSNNIKQCSKDKIQIIHHGLALESRKIENMIFMMDYLDDRFILDLMLVPNKLEYYNYLQKLCENRKNVNIIKPVNFQEIIRFSTQYDVGLFLLEPTNFNYEYALPNKFFEYIASNLAIAIGPSKEMLRILNKYDLGIASESFEPEDLAKKIAELDENKINHFKANSKKAFKELSGTNGFITLENEIIKAQNLKMELNR